MSRLPSEPLFTVSGKSRLPSKSLFLSTPVPLLPSPLFRFARVWANQNKGQGGTHVLWPATRRAAMTRGRGGGDCKISEQDSATRKGKAHCQPRLLFPQPHSRYPDLTCPPSCLGLSSAFCHYIGFCRLCSAQCCTKRKLRFNHALVWDSQ
jgi:hypothetical protein